MKILFYLGHPAHYHLFRNLFNQLKKNDHQIILTIKRKDILESLLDEAGLDYHNIYPRERSQSKIAILSALMLKDFRLARIALKYKPDIMLGTSIEIAQVGKILGIPSLVVNEDDFDVVPEFAKLGYPFANYIVAPECCRVGKWSHKKIGYQGYHELAYLAPHYFTPDEKTRNRYITHDSPYYILRFSKLKAYHDRQKRGITEDLAGKIVSVLSEAGEVYISSEYQLSEQLEKRRLQINPVDIHHLLYFATMYIGDSQTMAAEAAVLGTPSLRYNDFVGKIGYLEELEHQHHLTFGFKTSEPEKLLAKIDELLKFEDLKLEWRKRTELMLQEKIDLNELLYWLITNYPESAQKVMQNQGRFSADMMVEAC
jgi:predicted glycosyltransferase